ncbi:unnamed protein product [Acanthosepion pharaonis]|uniref:Uncharacterized protein n=1 Tax=Acanthosepion pharaonis TaxID=158019 RepID=A0A812DTI0_ACAPH|nr:unnamed protein product [Sepia pharaonis]
MQRPHTIISLFTFLIFSPPPLQLPIFHTPNPAIFPPSTSNGLPFFPPHPNPVTFSAVSPLSTAATTSPRYRATIIVSPLPPLPASLRFLASSRPNNPNLPATTSTNLRTRPALHPSASYTVPSPRTASVPVFPKAALRPHLPNDHFSPHFPAPRPNLNAAAITLTSIPFHNQPLLFPPFPPYSPYLLSLSFLFHQRLAVQAATSPRFVSSNDHHNPTTRLHRRRRTKPPPPSFRPPSSRFLPTPPCYSTLPIFFYPTPPPQLLLLPSV